MCLSRRVGCRLGVMILAVGIVLGGSVPGAWAERPPSPKLLPASTVALLAIPSVPELGERFMGTAMGRLSQDPQLQPLLKHLYGSAVDAVATVQDQLGLSLPELLAIPQGEVTVALVASDDAPPAVVFMLDVGDQRSNARKLLDRAIELLDRSGASKAEQTVADTKLLLYERLGDGGQGRLVILERDDTVVVGSDLRVIKQILEAWNGGKEKTLADNPDFVTIMRRCRGSKDQPPQFAFFLDPIGLMRGIGRNDVGVQVGLAALPLLGIDGLKAVGAAMTLDVDRFDSIFHAHVLLDTPRTGILKAIALKSGESTPEPWVPADVANYMTVHWDAKTTFEEFTKLYDVFRYEGALSESLRRRFVEPTGIDLEKQLLPALEGRVTLFTQLRRPATPQSLALLLALKLKDTEVFDEALQKVVKLSAGGLAKQSWAGESYYKVQPPDWERLEQLPPGQRPPIPCLGILDDYLILALRETIYRDAISALLERSERLADAPDFKLIMDEVGRQSGGATPAMLQFDRPEESMRWLYDVATAELAKEGFRRRAENDRFLQTLDTALKQNPLPPFTVLQQYLAPGGAMIVDDATGWHYTDFTLKPVTE